jgi:hypothetical protein
MGVPARSQPVAGDRAAALRAAGNAAANAGRDAEAVQAWRAAWEVQPGDPSLACDIGRGELATQNDVAAAEWMTRCVSLMAPKLGRETIHRRRSEVVDLALARSRVVSLVFDVEAGAEVFIDGKAYGPAPFSGPLFVKPGERSIEARKGRRVASHRLSAGAGEEHRIALALSEPSPLAMPRSEAVPIPAPPREKLSFFWPPAIIGGSLAITALGMGTVFFAIGDIAAKEQADAKKAALAATDGVGCGKLRHETCQTFTALDARRVTFVNASTGAFVAASVLGAATLGYAAFEKDRVSVSASVGGIVGRYTW